MTYFQFHLIFTVPPVVILSFLSWRVVASGDRLTGPNGASNRFALSALCIHIALALIYTTPWDNYLVYRQVWGYPEGRVWATIGYVPVEEYLFFILQTVLTGLLLCLLMRRLAPALSQVRRPGLIRFLGVLLSLLIAAAGVVALSTDRGTYLGLILVWGMPVLALQWGFGGDFIVARWRLALLAVGLPTLYLWIADRVAIGLGIWWISPDLTTGLKAFGLPLEEALFFLLTNCFVVFGMTLALHPASLDRALELRHLNLKLWHAALAAWVITMIPAPLLPNAFPLLAYVSTGFLALALLLYARTHYGARAYLLFAVAFGFGLAVEWVGKTTGVPFGAYRYTAPGPALLGVPLLVPLGWWAFSLIALAVAPAGTKYWLAPLALVAWDLGLDPLMVAQGFWQFEAGGIYYGVPLSNFIGWYISGAVLMAILLRLEPRLASDRAQSLQLIFLAQAFLMGVGLLFFGLPWAAVLSCLAMAAFVVPELRRNRKYLLPS